MKFLCLSPLLLMLLLTGCLQHPTQTEFDPGQLDLFGVVMFSDTDYREIRGVRGTDEPCLRGFERTFEPLDIVIGYCFDHRVRKITTRNPHTSLFGIHPGEPIATAREKLRANRFSEQTPYLFRRDGLIVTLLADTAGTLFGLTLEAVND